MIYVDADACPVKAEVESVATRWKMPVAMVTNGGLRLSRNPWVEIVFVDEGPDAADRWIAERCGPTDVVITGDIPLAARCVEAGSRVVKPNGETLAEANMGAALATRDLMADLRASDPFRQGAGKLFSNADRSKFRNSLDRALRFVSV